MPMPAPASQAHALFPVRRARATPSPPSAAHTSVHVCVMKLMFKNTNHGDAASRKSREPCVAAREDFAQEGIHDEDREPAEQRIDEPLRSERRAERERERPTRIDR